MNWNWFAEHLKEILSRDMVYTFICERHSGLLKAISDLFPGSYHSYCLWHLKQNLTNVISSRDPRRPYIRELFKRLAYAPTHHKFQEEY